MTRFSSTGFYTNECWCIRSYCVVSYNTFYNVVVLVNILQIATASLDVNAKVLSHCGSVAVCITVTVLMLTYHPILHYLLYCVLKCLFLRVFSKRGDIESQLKHEMETAESKLRVEFAEKREGLKKEVRPVVVCTRV